MAHGHDERKHSGFGQACSHAAAWNRSPAMELLCPARRCAAHQSHSCPIPFPFPEEDLLMLSLDKLLFFCDLYRKRAFPAEAGGVPYHSLAGKHSGGLPLRTLNTSH